MSLPTVLMEKSFSVPWISPGSWADSTVSDHFLLHFNNKNGNYKICVDQGFPQNSVAWNAFVGPIHERAAWQLHPQMRDYLIGVSNIYTSLRQASEWGMHGMQDSFPWCKKYLHTECNKHRLVLELIILIHNYRTELVGLNQVNTIFDPKYKWVVNLEGYDGISQHHLWLEDF